MCLHVYKGARARAMLHTLLPPDESCISTALISRFSPSSNLRRGVSVVMCRPRATIHIGIRTRAVSTPVMAPAIMNTTQLTKRRMPKQNVRKVKPEENTCICYVLRGGDVRIHQNLRSKVTKNHACNPDVIVDGSLHTNPQRGAKQATRNSSKI